jgi:type II secretory ATPase GspE/PulE/Tfp pilus assembly ATPase PilB-like protein
MWKLAELSVPQRIRIARTGSAWVRRILARDRDPLVADAARRRQVLMAERRVDGAALDGIRPLLAEAIARGASVVHLEPGGARLRIDGRLVPVQALAPLASTTLAVGRLAAGLGSGSVEVDGERWRVSVAEVLGGAHVCLKRVATGSRTLGELGLADVEASLRDLSGGLTLFCSPPGGGKSTTFYAALASLAHPERIVVAVEDAIERRVPGVLQLEGLAQAEPSLRARAIFAQDADVVGLGEIFDYATAQLAIECAMAAARVVSTIAVPRAAAAVGRLLNLGIEPYLVVSTLRHVVCQVLVRSSNGPLVAVHEVLEMTDELRDLVLQGASQAELQTEAEKRGMVTIPQRIARMTADGQLAADHR